MRGVNYYLWTMTTTTTTTTEGKKSASKHFSFFSSSSSCFVFCFCLEKQNKPPRLPIPPFQLLCPQLLPCVMAVALGLLLAMQGPPYPRCPLHPGLLHPMGTTPSQPWGCQWDNTAPSPPHCPLSLRAMGTTVRLSCHRTPHLPFLPVQFGGGGGRLGLRWKLQRGNLMRSKPFVQMVKNAKTSKRQPGGDKRSNPFGPGRGLGGGGDDSVLCHSLSPPRCHFSFEC